MREKILTGLVLFVAFTVLAWLDIYALNFVLFVVILAVAYSESAKLFGVSDESKYFVLIAIAFFVALPFVTLEAPFSAAVKLSFFMLIFVASIQAYFKISNLKIILPFIYPVVPIFIMFSLYSDLGIAMFVWMILIVICSDSGAYFVGKAIGKIHFNPSSPNKTLEGVIGGFIFAIIISFLYAKIFTNADFKEIVYTTLVVSVFGVFGDLFESYLKRLANVKDSGEILPGHGGILDRIDGYLFGAIAMLLVYAW